MEVYLVDGTYELFRHYYALPPARDEQGREVAAVRGVLQSMLGMLKGGITYLAVATDHVVESFRNDLWADYKTSEGVEPELLAQFLLLEEILSAAGIVLWPMVEFEADDALAAGALTAARDSRVERVVVCTPDKDLAQCVSGTRIVQLNRRTGVTLDEAGVRQNFGVLPASIPDYLALVGDSADGYPGLQGWGRKRRPPCWASFYTWRPFRKTGASGTSTLPTRALSLRLSPGNGITPSCFALWQRFELTLPFSKMWNSCVGPVPSPDLTRWRPD